MDHDVGLGMQERACLGTDGLNNPGVTMTGIGHADATSEIEIFLAIGGIDVGPFGALCLDGENPRPDRRHVREIFFVELRHIGLYVPIDE